jgi:hypothetical protein
MRMYGRLFRHTPSMLLGRPRCAISNRRLRELFSISEAHGIWQPDQDPAECGRQPQDHAA